MKQSRVLHSNQVIRFRSTVYGYYRRHSRKLPWRRTRDPYKILVSEIMLQQTQVPRVIEKYQEFMRAFPTTRRLARAPLRRIMAVWQGLGYNRRALLLKKLAMEVVRHHGAKIPQSAEALASLPGIGHATASAICVYAFNQPKIFIETNIRSVFIHHFFKDKNSISDQALLPFIQSTLDRAHPRRWYSALMDYGVFLKSTVVNPSRKSAHYKKQSRFEGSDRQLRGRILRSVLKKGKASEASLLEECGGSQQKINRIILQLCREGLLQRRGAYLAV